MVVSGIQDSGNNITSTDYKYLGNCLVLCILVGIMRLIFWDSFVLSFPSYITLYVHGVTREVNCFFR
jgi:hypothetical protein